MFRGDMFVVTMANKLLCIDCWSNTPGVDAEMHSKSMAVFDAVMAKSAEAAPASAEIDNSGCRDEGAPLVYDGDFPE